MTAGPRGDCQRCGKNCALTKRGQVRQHRVDPSSPLTCSGSGRHPIFTVHPARISARVVTVHLPDVPGETPA